MEYFQKALQRYESYCKKSGAVYQQANQYLSSTEFAGNNVIVTLRNSNGDLFTTTFKKIQGV